MRRIVGLLNLQYMCGLKLPPRTYRKPGVAYFVWHRYLFKHHIQHILNWKERLEESDPRGFDEEVNSIIRNSLFPDLSGMSNGKNEGRRQGVGKRKAIRAIPQHVEATLETGYRESRGVSRSGSSSYATCAPNSGGQSNTSRGVSRAGDGWNTPNCELGGDPRRLVVVIYMSATSDCERRSIGPVHIALGQYTPDVTDIHRPAEFGVDSTGPECCAPHKRMGRGSRSPEIAGGSPRGRV